MTDQNEKKPIDKKTKDKLLLGRKSPDMTALEPNRYVFVSYAHENAEAAIEVLDILDRNNYAYWFDSGIKSGQSWADEINSRIENCGLFLLLMSNAALTSKNVLNEINAAIEFYDKPIVIVYLDDVKLRGELVVRIGRIQGIKRSLIADPSDFERRLCISIAPKFKWDHAETANENNRNLDSILTRLREKYEDLCVISDKGTRKTFSGRNRTTGMTVFIKQYIVSDDAPENKLLFESEKKALMNCTCQGVPALLDVYEDNSGGFIVESYIYGRRLTECSGLTELEVLRIGLRLAYSLRFIHRCNFVHCDIKPDNVLVSDFGEAYLIDFNSSQNTLQSSTFWSRGTAYFAAPEQYQRNYRPDFRTDFFSLGKTLEAALSGFSPKKADPKPFASPSGARRGRSGVTALLKDTIPPGLTVGAQNRLTGGAPTVGAQNRLTGGAPTVGTLPVDTFVSSDESSETFLPTQNSTEFEGTMALFGLMPEYSGIIRAENIHPQLRKLLDHLTAEDPNARPKNCEELIDEMNKCRLILELEEALGSAN